MSKYDFKSHVLINKRIISDHLFTVQLHKELSKIEKGEMLLIKTKDAYSN